MSSPLSRFIPQARVEGCQPSSGRQLALLRQALANGRASQLVNIVASTGIALMLGAEKAAWMWWWLSAVALTTALRLGVDMAMRWRLAQSATPTPVAVNRMVLLHCTGLALGGSLWVCLAWFGLPLQDLEGQLKLIIVQSAMAGGAVGVLAPLRRMGPAYIGMLLLPACLQLAWLPHPQIELAVLGGVFCVVMIIGHRNNHGLILNSLRLQEDNIDLIRDLQHKHAEVQAMNLLLEDRVAQRTEDLRAMAHHDALTGLFNRRGILLGLERLEARGGTDRHGQRLGALFLDLDRFKQINDGIGHDVGDLVLMQVARRFRACVPEGAVFGRWGGDEFIVLIGAAAGGVHDIRAHALQVASALMASLDGVIEVRDERINLGLSIGVAICPSQASSSTELIRAADLAAAEAKRQGRDRVVEFEEVMFATQRRRLEISLALRHATSDDSLRLVYQPIVDARTGRVMALEALLRWRSATLGEVRPDEFIPIAEESDRIVSIGTWVLNRACREAMTWCDATMPPRVAVNVSVRQLLRADFPATVAGVLQSTGLPADRLTLEVTESVFAEQNSADALEALMQLHAMGVQIDVDDFGTGYSSLSRLREFPLDAVKIDRSFVNVLDGPSCAIIEGTVLMARRFGLVVIAEGVETREQAQHLIAMGVGAFQGYLLGRPADVPRLQPLQPFWAGETASTLSAMAELPPA